MYKVIVFFTAFMLTVGVMYVLFSFGNGSFEFTEWTDRGRQAFPMIAGILGFFAGLNAVEDEE